MTSERTLSGRDPGTGEVVTVTVRAGRVATVEPGGVDDGNWLAPGLVDLQVNGFGGYDVNAEDVDPETIIALTGLTLGEAIRLATEQPGRFVGGRGRLEVGDAADLIRFAWSPGDGGLTIESVYVLGVEQPQALLQ